MGVEQTLKYSLQFPYFSENKTLNAFLQYAQRQLNQEQVMQPGILRDYYLQKQRFDRHSV